MLRNLDNNLWVCEQPLSYYGLAVGARMTVIRLSSGGLLLHSPVQPTPELQAEVDALGKVEFLVGPNRFHHLFIKPWMEAHPQAQAYAAPGLDKKRGDIAFRSVLDDSAGMQWGWSPDVEHLLWRGAPMMNEVVFFHPATRTLILTDTAHNLGGERPWWTRTVFRMLGGFGGFKTSLLDRMVARDRVAVRATVEKILAWEFERVIVAHGSVLDSGGREAMRRAYSWVLRA
jgi:Domain of unknown function (DUF4336)